MVCGHFPFRKALLVRSHCPSHSWELSCRLILGAQWLSFFSTQVHVQVEGGKADSKCRRKVVGMLVSHMDATASSFT